MFQNSLKTRNITEIFPRRELTADIMKMACRDRSPFQALCLTVIFLFVGAQNDQFNTVSGNSISRGIFKRLTFAPRLKRKSPLQTLFPTMSKYYPSGTSIRTLLHFYQMYTSGTYKQFDHGREDNLKIYNQEEPPDYDISKISVPISLHYGDGDTFVDRKVSSNNKIYNFE